MQYNFDDVLSRANTRCLKYDRLKEFFGNENLLPMWIADMDFPIPAFILDPIKKRLEHPIFGYFYHSESFYHSIVQWMQKRHQWNISAKWICFSPGIVAGLSFLIQLFSQKNEKILIQTPVYPPFYEVIEKNGRQILTNPLSLCGDRYNMDFNDLEEKLKQGPKIMIVSNPHNPVARCWLPNELKTVAELCLKYHCLLISDEIHSDLIMTGYKHTPIAKLSDEIAQNTITCMAPSKTFNLAGLATSEIIIPNPVLRDQFKNFMNNTVHIFGNIFGDIALENAYTYGADWLDQLCCYLTENVKYCKQFLAEYLPEIKTYQHEATYLLWVNFKQLGYTHEELTHFLIEKAHLGLNDGKMFGKEGEQFMRLNLACPRSILNVAMHQLYDAIKIK